jgi:hypothetical protein
MASGNKPYVHINDRLRHYPALKAQLGGGVKFDLLNKHNGNRRPHAWRKEWVLLDEVLYEWRP